MLGDFQLDMGFTLWVNHRVDLTRPGERNTCVLIMKMELSYWLTVWLGENQELIAGMSSLFRVLLCVLFVFFLTCLALRSALYSNLDQQACSFDDVTESADSSRLASLTYIYPLSSCYVLSSIDSIKKKKLSRDSTHFDVSKHRMTFEK